MLQEVSMKRMGKLVIHSILGAEILGGLVLLPVASSAQLQPGAFSGGIHYPIAGAPAADVRHGAKGHPLLRICTTEP
jgi:hypothetical protein